MRLVMNNDLTKGGHLSSQPMGALFNFVEEDPQTGKENIVHLPLSRTIPINPTRRPWPSFSTAPSPSSSSSARACSFTRSRSSAVAEIVKDWNPRPVMMFDMAHVLGLYGAFQEPFKEGADIVTGSTHKTFFGTQRGLVAGNFPKESPLRNLWLDIKGRAFPGSTSNHHLGTLLGLLMASYEMNEFKTEFQNQVQGQRQSVRPVPQRQGHPGRRRRKGRVHRNPSGPHPGQSLRSRQEIARRLEENNIVANYQALPDDETFLESSGIRMGVQEMTRFGMKEKDFDELAGYIADVVIRNKTVKDAVKIPVKISWRWATVFLPGRRSRWRRRSSPRPFLIRGSPPGSPRT